MEWNSTAAAVESGGRTNTPRRLPKKTIRRLGLVASMSAALAGVSLATSPSAHAASYYVYVSSNCGGSQGCSYDALELTYNSNVTGAQFWWQGNNPDYGGYLTQCGVNYCTTVYVFESVPAGGATNGQGLPVKNNAAAACSYSTTYAYYVYYNSNYMGHSQKFDGICNNLDSTLKNDNASQKMVS